MWNLLPTTWKLGLIVAVVTAAIGGLTGVYFKIRHDAVVEERAKIEAEKRDAIDKAQTARTRIRELCDASPDKCVPDDFFRD